MKKSGFSLVELPVVRKRGFTLIELLIVVAIIGILTVLVVIAFQNSQAKARDVKRKADIKAIAAALEAYRANKGITLKKCSSVSISGRSNMFKIDRDDNQFGCTEVVWADTMPTDLINNLIKDNYIPGQPRDPQYVANGPIGYYLQSDASNFKVVSYKPELLKGKTDSAECQSIAGEYYDPKDPCDGYQVSSNSDATKGW